MRSPQPSSWAFWLSAALPALALALFLLSANWPTYRKLAADGVPTGGVVTSTGCGTGGRFDFVFQAEGESWAGHGRAWRIDMPCARLTPGRRVPVYYVLGQPEENAATRDPEALARQEVLVVTAFGVVSFIIFVLLFWVQARRSGAEQDAP